MTPAPLLVPYRSPIIMVTEPVRSESGPQLAAPARKRRGKQWRRPQSAIKGIRPKVRVLPTSA